MGRHIGSAITQRNMLTEIERRSDENRKLYDDLRMTYADTVKAFAAAIDFKDKYTEGHSVRVGKYSEIIGAELSWARTVEGCRGCGLSARRRQRPSSARSSMPRRINAKESAELNKHPPSVEIMRHPSPVRRRGRAQSINLATPRRRGYPDCLCDRQIPYIGKVVNLADSSINEHRPALPPRGRATNI